MAVATRAVESWDDEFEGNFTAIAAHSTGTANTNISSRVSVHSESVAAGDDDWNLVLEPNDEHSTHQALQSAKAAGIPLPENVPQSALLGGTIKRLGKKKSKQRVRDDWDEDLEMPDSGALQLKPLAPVPNPWAEEHDDFDELEGSLGIRFAGSGRNVRNRSSSASAMSPSLGSMTAESEEDELRGLELPEGPVDFDAMLRKRRAADAELSDLSQPSPAIEQQASMKAHKKSKLEPEESDDYIDDFDIGTDGILDSRRRNVNRNIKVKTAAPVGHSRAPATTISFHDRPVDKPTHTRIPRPVSGSKPAGSRLEPVFETGASRVIRERRQPTSAGAQLLKSKRSAPALRSCHTQPTPVHKPSMPFLSAAVPSNQTQHAATQRMMPYHIRRESDTRGGAQSPPFRSHSRLSNTYTPDTPSRAGKQRPVVASSSLVREAATKRTITKPTTKRNYGTGKELDVFDDLPTSVAKESRFVKQPVGRGPPRPSLRTTQSRSDLRDQYGRTIPDRMATPGPPRTPVSPTRGLHDGPAQTPSYLRDTAASRIARETRLGSNNPRPRSEGPLMPLTSNWKTQVAARNPHTSPTSQRHKPRKQQPQLIKGIGSHVAKTERGMVYNPQTLRWEGNENSIANFDMLPPVETPTPTGNHPQTSYMDRHYGSSGSPPRPALIAPMSNAAVQGIQVNGGMVFDPRQMKWLKLKEGRDVSGPLSPSITDGEEEDAFAGIEDLKDGTSPAPPLASSAIASPAASTATGVGEVHEEFDLGPRFIEMQQSEESVWQKRCTAWFPGGDARADDGRWRWAIRDIARDGGP